MSVLIGACVEFLWIRRGERVVYLCLIVAMAEDARFPMYVVTGVSPS